MKKILLVILAVIVLIFGYSQYKEYQRFHPKNANLKASEAIDVNYHNQETVFNYYAALEKVNNYMQMQWSANGIDVRSPENDNEQTALVIAEYGKKVAEVNYYQSILEQSKTLKSQGLDNDGIKFLETNSLSIDDFNKAEDKRKQKQLLLDMMPKKALFMGEKSPFVFEIQKLLVKKGYDISLDGVYQIITSDALKSFEEKNSLFPDGKIDLMTLDLLLN